MTAQRTFLVTGAAGFIGFHLAQKLARAGFNIVGVDNLNSYYDISLKQARLAKLKTLQNFTFMQVELADSDAVAGLFGAHEFDRVIHLAAQAGVRFSMSEPHQYISANITGFFNVLDACEKADIEHFIYASSSSVYGANKTVPFRETDRVDHPVNLYAATKRSNELMAHSHAHIYGLASTGLRFFTVYGPWGRPDMAYFHFTRAILTGKKINVFNHGNMRRDFTYIDDIVESIMRLIDIIPERDPHHAPATFYNIGRNQPENLLRIINIIEEATGHKAQMEMLPMQPGEMLDTYADSTPLIEKTGFEPKVNIEDGLVKFVNWYREFYAA